MSRALKITILLQGIIALIFGAPLFIAPGRFLGLFGWAPVEPLLDRLLGAALLGLAWLCWRAWQANQKSQVTHLIEFALILNGLGAVGFLRHLLIANYRAMVWTAFAILLISAIAWAVQRFRR